MRELSAPLAEGCAAGYAPRRGQMKLYHHPLSTYARRVTMAATEKDLELETVFVDMAAREHRGDAYRALNPYGRVPTLVDGDLVLYESTATEVAAWAERILSRPSAERTKPKS